MKRILAIDLEPRIYPTDPYESQRFNEWPIDKPPVEGAFDYLHSLMEHFEIHVISWRASHYELLRWFKTFHFPCDKDGRPEGIHLRIYPEAGTFVYLGARVIPLEAGNPSVIELTKFQPYATEGT